MEIRPILDEDGLIVAILHRDGKMERLIEGKFPDPEEIHPIRMTAMEIEGGLIDKVEVPEDPTFNDFLTGLRYRGFDVGEEVEISDEYVELPDPDDLTTPIKQPSSKKPQWAPIPPSPQHHGGHVAPIAPPKPLSKKEA